MRNNYLLLGIRVLLGLSVALWTNSALAQSTTNCCSNCIASAAIVGPDVLITTDLYYLNMQAGPGVRLVKWTARPANLFTVPTSTNSTLLTGPAGCVDNAAATITAYLIGCNGDTSIVTKPITVQTAAPAISGTYKCTTCSDQTARTLPLDASTISVSPGTYRLDLTSRSSQDTFLAWDTFEAAGSTFQVVSGTQNRSGTFSISSTSNNAKVAANATNGCKSARQPFFFSVPSSMRAAAQPNPASDQLTVGQTAEPTELTTQGAPASPSEARLYNDQGLEVRRSRGVLGQLKVEVRTLPSGFYTLRTITGTQVTNERIHIAH